MPKRSDREVFARAFNGNPFKGKSPVSVYKEIQWGNEPNEIIDIESPEPLVALGYLAKLFFTTGHKLSFRKGLWHLALGIESNNLYLFPKNSTFIPEDEHGWNNSGKKLKQTDYYSDKGGDDCYYFHKHESPYPYLFSHESGTAHIIVPQNHNGRRSYAVIKEGIVG